MLNFGCICQFVWHTKLIKCQSQLSLHHPTNKRPHYQYLIHEVEFDQISNSINICIFVLVNK